MAHKEREGEVEERPSERRHRSKSEKDPTKKHKSSRSSRPKVIDPETGEVVKSPHRSRKDKDQDKKSEPSKSMADLVPELARTASAPGATSRGSIPYPSFNKAHSKEAVSSREDFRLPTRAQPNVYTPESTDLGSEEKLRSKSAEHFTPPRGAATFKDGRPPSPPETDISQQRKATPSRMTKVQEEVKTESRPSSRNSWFSRSTKERDEGSKVSSKSKASKASTAIKSPQFKADGEDEKKERVVETQDDSTESEADSNLTSVAPKREPSRAGPPPPALDTDSSPESAQDSSPQTPTQAPQFPPPNVKSTPSPFPYFEPPSATPSSAFNSPQPPPTTAPTQCANQHSSSRLPIEQWRTSSTCTKDFAVGYSLIYSTT